MPKNDAVWTMHSEQLSVFQSRARFKTVMAGRRGGKSDLGIMWIFQQAQNLALQKRDGVIWIVEPTSGELPTMWRKAANIVPKSWVTDRSGTEKAPNWMKLGDRVIVQFRSADAPERLVTEGLLAVWIDECGFIQERVWSESVRPALMDHRAPALFTGTPKGKNWFYWMYSRGLNPDDERYASFHWNSFANPYIDAEEIEDIAKDMPERLYRQEILAEPQDDAASVFRGVRDAIISEPSKLKTEVVGVDLAKTEDFTVMVGLDANGEMTFIDRFNQISWPLQKERVISKSNETGAFFVIDSTGVGDPVVEDLSRSGVNVDGFKFTSQSKAQLVEGLEIAIEQGRIKILNDPVLVSELEAFSYQVTRQGNVQYRAPTGIHDDCVMALALARYAIRFKGRQKFKPAASLYRR